MHILVFLINLRANNVDQATYVHERIPSRFLRVLILGIRSLH
jgi:hypothetical protein